MFDSVYVCRNTDGLICVVPVSIGIVKLKGCVEFYCAIKDIDGDYGFIYDLDKEEYISVTCCRKKYDSVPGLGEAWLVEEGRKWINWTQVDHEMHLLDKKGKIVKE